MTSIKLIVSGASARAEVDGLLTSGMVGIPVTIVCDGVWDGLTKSMVCRAGHIVKTILNVGNTATVAHECMVPNQTLFIGIEGRNADGTLVIPTVWARCGLICSGANADADHSTDPTLPVWAQIQAMIGNLDDLNTQAKENLVAAINEALTQGGGEVDPEAVKRIVEDYLAANPPTVTETDPTVPAWAKEAQKPSYTASEVGADPSGTAAAQVTAHNTAEAAHNDIRLLISGLTNRLNALADSDDTTLDQLSEVVLYIKNNRELISAITTDKVSVADIIDNLTTNVSNKPLSAAQGVALKALIDTITVPDKLPNPNALTFTGAVTGTYDGSAAVSVEIPAGGGGSGGVNYTLAVDVLASGTVAAGSTGTVDTGVKLSDLKQYKLFIVSVSGASNNNLINWYTKLGSLCINRVNGLRAKTILYEFLNDNKNLLFPRIGAAGNHGVYSSYIGNGSSYGTNNNAQFPDCIYDLSSIGDDNSIIIQPTSATIDVNWCIMGVAK